MGQNRTSIFVVIALFAALLSTGTQAQDSNRFRIGTGGIGGTYFPIGQIIAEAISSKTGLSASARTSRGSIENIAGLVSGDYDGGFVQSDVAFWAHTGSGTFAEQGPQKSLRAVASLYPESIHVVARQAARIQTLDDLKSRAVSLGPSGSGTLADTRLILSLVGLDEKRDIRPLYLESEVAVDRLLRAEIDAYFAVAGFPAKNVTRAVANGSATVLPITGMAVDILLLEHGFLSRGEIPAGVYRNDTPIPTVNVSALLLVPASMDAERVYQITRALWSGETRQKLDAGHAKGKLVTLDTALVGIGIPLHPGAERFYRDRAMIK